jgi:hypothetical protein
MSDRFDIDPKRIHAAGFSQGGVFVSTLAIKLGDVLASVCSYMGGLQIVNAEGCTSPRFVFVFCCLLVSLSLYFFILFCLLCFFLFPCLVCFVYAAICSYI